VLLSHPMLYLAFKLFPLDRVEGITSLMQSTEGYCIDLVALHSNYQEVVISGSFLSTFYH